MQPGLRNAAPNKWQVASSSSRPPSPPSPSSSCIIIVSVCAFTVQKGWLQGELPASHSWEAPNVFIVSLPKSGSGFERLPRHPAGWFNVTFHLCGVTVSFPFRKAPKKFIPHSKKTNKRAPISGWEREAKNLKQS